MVLNWLKEAYLPYLICYKERNLSVCSFLACRGMVFIKKISVFRKKNVHFVLFHLDF